MNEYEYYEEQKRNKGCMPCLINLTFIFILIVIVAGSYTLYTAWQDGKLSAYSQPTSIQESTTIIREITVTVVSPVTPTPAISLVPWPRPITPEQYAVCIVNPSVNPACPGWGE